MNTVEERKVRKTEKELKEMAQNHLIAARRCSRHKDGHYTVICYGPDSISLDASRKWLYDEEIAINNDVDNAMFIANKTVLYVNEKDLETKIHELRQMFH